MINSVNERYNYWISHKKKVNTTYHYKLTWRVQHLLFAILESIKSYLQDTRILPTFEIQLQTKQSYILEPSIT